MTALARHLATTRLAGDVATTPRQTIANCRKLSTGDPDYTFGLDDAAGTPMLEALDAVQQLCGGDPGGNDLDGPGWIDPERVVAAVDVHRRALAAAASQGSRVLLATGHPGGLLAHYAALARALQGHGCELLTPLDDVVVARSPAPDGGRARKRAIRFTDGVACEFDGASLRHTHRPDLMQAMLDELDGRATRNGRPAVDLVIADHGLAGAAVQRGIRTLSIADVNDPALPLAQVRGRTDGVLPIDDNLAPRHFVPVTQAMLRW